MKTRKSVLLAFFMILLFVFPAWAAQLNGKLTVEDGSFFCMGAPYPMGSCVALSAGSDGGILLGQHQPFVLDPDEPHPAGWNGPGSQAGTGYSGTPTSPSNILNPFSFFGTPTYIGTNPISYQSGETHPAPTADVDGTGNLHLEISAWEVMWNGSAFEQGPRPGGLFVLAEGTLDLATGSYSINWPSKIKGGPFGGVTGYWLLVGHFEPAPLMAGVLAEPLTLNVKSQGNGFTVSIELQDTDGSLVPAANIADGVMITSVGAVTFSEGAVVENVADRIIRDQADPANHVATPNGIDELAVAFDDPATGSRQDVIGAASQLPDGSIVDVCVKGSATDAIGTLRPFEACSSITILNKGNR